MSRVFLDKNGKQILAGMTIRMEDGSLEKVYATSDAYGEESLGINTSNEAYLQTHPSACREYYSLTNFNLAKTEIVD